MELFWLEKEHVDWKSLEQETIPGMVVQISESGASGTPVKGPWPGRWSMRRK